MRYMWKFIATPFRIWPIIRPKFINSWCVTYRTTNAEWGNVIRTKTKHDFVTFDARVQCVDCTRHALQRCVYIYVWCDVCVLQCGSATSLCWITICNDIIYIFALICHNGNLAIALENVRIVKNYKPFNSELTQKLLKKIENKRKSYMSKVYNELCFRRRLRCDWLTRLIVRDVGPRPTTHQLMTLINSHAKFQLKDEMIVADLFWISELVESTMSLRFWPFSDSIWLW